jgi:hypothetical protein
VTTESQHFLDLLEQRVALLTSLAESLSAASSSLVSFDIDSLESRIAQQERLCTDIRALDTQIDRVQRQCATQLGASATPSAVSNSAPDAGTLRLRETSARLTKIQSTVKQLNDAHRILLRRSRRTVSALLNSYHSFAPTYSDPASPRVSIGERA